MVVLLLVRPCPTGSGKTAATDLETLITYVELTSLGMECPSSCIAGKHRQIELFVRIPMQSLSH